MVVDQTCAKDDEPDGNVDSVEGLFEQRSVVGYGGHEAGVRRPEFVKAGMCSWP